MKRGSKKSQISVFIIIGMIFLLIIFIFILIRSKNTFPYKDPEINQINEQIKNCLEQRSIDAIYLIGLQGGYVNPPAKNYLKTDSFDMAYWLKNNRKTLPSIKTIEKEISNYVKISSYFCINRTNYKNLIITQKNPDIEVTINRENVEIKALLNTAIKKDKRVYELKEAYKIAIQIRLGHIYKTAEKIIKKHLEDNEYIDVGYLTSFDLEISFMPFDNETLIYIITDEKSKINETPYSFMFVVGK